jgi:hypothetical protein
MGLRRAVVYLAWAWMILVGVLLITPGGVFCIACGSAARGYIGDGAVLVLGVGSIGLGIFGIASGLRAGSAGNQAAVRT